MFLLFFLSGFSTLAQVKDTVRIMHYNLLYYGEATTNCTANNNSVNNKDSYLKTIVNHVRPDIFTINEMGCNSVYARRIRDLVLNTVDSIYELTTLQVGSSQNICNMLFYNTNKVKVASQEKITTASNGTSIVRAIDLYELQFLSTNLSENHIQLDTPSTNFLTMHLKASSGTANKAQREVAAAGVMEYLEANNNPGNYILSGDLNLYTHTEKAWENFTDWTAASYNFYDPINRVGSWGNNSSFADVHTQSTHTSQGCHSSGGMDDRFDFIMMSENFKTSSELFYISDSYKAVGNNGNCYNSYVSNTSCNGQFSQNLRNALYYFSDHLPVVMEIETPENTLSIPKIENPISLLSSNLVDKNLIINNKEEINILVIYNQLGQKVLEKKNLSNNRLNINASSFSKGIYYIKTDQYKPIKFVKI